MFNWTVIIQPCCIDRDVGPTTSALPRKCLQKCLLEPLPHSCTRKVMLLTNHFCRHLAGSRIHSSCVTHYKKLFQTKALAWLIFDSVHILPVSSEWKLSLGSQMVPGMPRWFVFLTAGSVTACRFRHAESQLRHFLFIHFWHNVCEELWSQHD